MKVSEYEVIHLVRTHKGGEGSSKSVRHAYKGGAYTWKYVRKNIPFCTCFVIFSYAGSFYHAFLSLA